MCQSASFVQIGASKVSTGRQGDWAGAVWTTDSKCQSLAATCSDYVQKGSNWANAVWEARSLPTVRAHESEKASTGEICASVCNIKYTQSTTLPTMLYLCGDDIVSRNDTIYRKDGTDLAEICLPIVKNLLLLVCQACLPFGNGILWFE